MNKFKSFFCRIDQGRERLENDVADKLDALGKSPQYVRLKNKGADALVERGIMIGIALASSQTGSLITIDENTIHKIADKGGGGLVKVWDVIIGCFKVQLRR